MIRDGATTGTAAAGTDAGRYTSQPTGAWPTDVATFYPTWAACQNALTPPADGDTILIAQDHYENNTTGSTNFNSSGYGYSERCTWISVSVTNCDQYDRATSKQFETSGNSSYDVNFGGGDGTQNAFYGIWVNPIDTCVAPSGSGTSFMYEVTMEFNNNNNGYIVSSGHSVCIDCDIVLGHLSGRPFSQGAGTLDWYGGSVSGIAWTEPVVFRSTSNHNGNILLHGVDLTAQGADYLVELFSSSNSDAAFVHFENCKLSTSSLGPESGSGVNQVQSMLLTNSATTSAGAEYQYFYRRGGYTAEDESGVYRTSTFAFPSGDKTSYKVTTTADCYKGFPFTVTLKPRYVDLTNAASDTLTVHFASADALDNSQVFAVVRYPTAADLSIAGSTDNAPAAVETRLGLSGTPTSYTDNAEGWFNGPANTYSLSVTVTGGAACVPVIDLYIAYDTGINPLYVCPKIDVS